MKHKNFQSPYITDYNNYYEYLWEGPRADPRGYMTRQRLAVSTTFASNYIPRRRRDNPAIGLIEMLQFIAGIFDHDAIRRVAPNAKLHLFTNQSAYGPRAGNQWEKIIDVLKGDMDSRRAVMVLRGPEENLHDAPCTTSLQFLVFGGFVDVDVVMRSSDAVWGLPYDLIQFSGALTAIAFAINRAPGDIHLHIGNAHIYEKTEVPIKSWRMQSMRTRTWDNVLYADTFEGTRSNAMKLLESMPDRATLENIFLEEDYNDN